MTTIRLSGSISKHDDAVSDLVQPIIGAIEGFISRIENFCTSDSDCSTTDEFCNPLQFGCREKRENGFFPCIKDSQCYSDRCVDTTRICESKKSNGSSCLADKECLSDTCAGICGVQCGIDSDCGSDEWCNPNYSPNLCRPKRENGYWPCVDDSQCYSDRCVDTTRTCESKKSEWQLLFFG